MARRRKRSSAWRRRGAVPEESATAPPTTPADLGYWVGDLHHNDLPWLSGLLGVDTSGLSHNAGTRKLAEALASRDRWEEWLRERSAGALVVLEVLAEIGTPVYGDDLTDLCLDRGFSDAHWVEHAIGEVVGCGLAAGLTSEESSDEMDVISPWRGSCAPLRTLVQGITLPADPPDASAIPEDGLRELLAAAGLTAHRRIRFTQREEPDRTSLRSFAKGLGPKSDALRSLLQRGIHHDLLRARQERLVPRAADLLRAARRSPDEELIDLVPESGWVPLAAVARADVKRLADARRPEADPRKRQTVVMRDRRAVLLQCQRLLEEHPGLERVHHEAATWIRRVPRSGEATGDGHVTPSFEVMLGPGASLEIVARIALGCELMQLDRVLRFRITPDSVAAGLRCGLGRSELLDALDRVGRHPVPDSVRLLVGEWADDKPSARVESGWFMLCEALAADPARQQELESGPLGSYLLPAPTRGILALAPDTPVELLESQLAAQGLGLGIDHPMDEAQLQREARCIDPTEDLDLDGLVARSPEHFVREDEPEATPGEPPWPLDARGHPELRARVDAARASGFETAPMESLPEGAEAQLGTDSQSMAELAAAMEELVPGAGRELARFRRKLAPDEQRRLEGLQSEPLAIVPFAALTPKWQRRCARQAADVDELLRLADEHCARDRLSAAGRLFLGRLALIRTAFSGGGDLTPTQLLDSLGRSPYVKANREASSTQTNRTARATEVRFGDPEAPSCGEPHPAPADFPELTSPERMGRLAARVEKRRPLFVLCHEGSTHVVRHLLPRAVRLEGQHQVLLGMDLDTGEDRAIPVRGIQSVVW